MTDPAPRRRVVATRWRTLVLLAATVAALAGCELATGTVRTATELQDAGIRDPNLQYEDGVARLDYDADPNPLEARAEQDRAAEIIWRNLPFRVDRIVVRSRSGDFLPARREYPRAVLEQRFGPRPDNLDRSASDIARRAVLIAGVVALVVLVAVVLIIVLVVRAVRRRPTPQPAGPWPQGGGPQQPWGQPGWGQPAPPGQPAGPGQPGWGQPPATGQPGWSQPPSGQWPPPQTPPPPQAPPPARGPGDTQRLEPPSAPPGDQGPPEAPGERGPVPPP